MHSASYILAVCAVFTPEIAFSRSIVIVKTAVGGYHYRLSVVIIILCVSKVHPMYNWSNLAIILRQNLML